MASTSQLKINKTKFDEISVSLWQPVFHIDIHFQGVFEFPTYRLNTNAHVAIESSFAWALLEFYILNIIY